MLTVKTPGAAPHSVSDFCDAPRRIPRHEADCTPLISTLNSSSVYFKEGSAPEMRMVIMCERLPSRFHSAPTC